VSFDSFKLSSEILEGIGYLGFENPTPIQTQAIPLILEGKDLVACAQTGTGKTGAFLLPILDKIIREERHEGQINTLIICPTRELAMQIDQQIEALGYFTGASSISIYGGGDGSGFDQQKKALSEGIDIVVATPGKLISHLNLGYVKVEQLKHLILDEADRMLDMGFYEDLMRIVKFLPKDRQTLLFSATLAPKIRTLSKTLLKDPESINISLAKPAEGVIQGAYLVFDDDKPELIRKILEGKKINSAIIFSSTKQGVKSISRILKNSEFNIGTISSDLTQTEREETLRLFSNKKIQILVATDVISRGIDIQDIELIINYNVPKESADYVHRVGRTARAKKSGVALTLINKDDQRRFKAIEDLIETEIMKLPNPEGVPKGPEYNPKSGGFKKKFYNKNKGGKRPYKKH